MRVSSPVIALWSNISRSRIAFLFAFRSAPGSQRMHSFCAVIAFHKCCTSKKFPPFTVDRTLVSHTLKQTIDSNRDAANVECNFFFRLHSCSRQFFFHVFFLFRATELNRRFFPFHLVDGWFAFVTISWWLSSIVARRSGRRRYHSWIVHMSLQRVFVYARSDAEKNILVAEIYASLKCEIRSEMEASIEVGP